MMGGDRLEMRGWRMRGRKKRERRM
jgi:hypothetical protein